MARSLLPLVLVLLGGCSSGPDADLQYIKQARSVAAEWAMVNQEAQGGKLTQAYAASMHQWLRDNLQSSAEALTVPNSAYGAEIRALLKQPDEASPATLRACSNKLKQIEDSLESA